MSSVGACNSEGQDASRRLPEWLRRPIAAPGRSGAVTGLLGRLRLNTVCQSAKCPNRGECFAEGTATFLVMGDVCTRDCRFCAVEPGVPGPLDPDEPRRVAAAAKRMGLAHVVVTTVTRDDLADGGAAHLVSVLTSLREAMPQTTVELLTSDFGGNGAAVDLVAAARPDVFNHNVETVPRLYERVRPGADYQRSLAVLARVRATEEEVLTKSGLMLGLGETGEEVRRVMRDLRAAGVTLLTVGQYLRPSESHLPIERFVEPEEFVWLETEALAMGFRGVASAPYARSSYRAGEMRLEAASR